MKHMFACGVAVHVHKSSCKVLTKTAMLRNVLGKVAGPAGSLTPALLAVLTLPQGACVSVVRLLHNDGESIINLATSV